MGAEDMVGADVCWAWLDVSLVLPKDSWSGVEVSWLPAIREQTLHVAVGVETTGDT